jgi:hypothetical protein
MPPYAGPSATPRCRRFSPFQMPCLLSPFVGAMLPPRRFRRHAHAFFFLCFRYAFFIDNIAFTAFRLTLAALIFIVFGRVSLSFSLTPISCISVISFQPMIFATLSPLSASLSIAIDVISIDYLAFIISTFSFAIFDIAIFFFFAISSIFH